MDQICETYFPIIILEKERADSFNHLKNPAQFPQSKKKIAHNYGLLSRFISHRYFDVSLICSARRRSAGALGTDR
jgi:hypothetical protein